MVIWNGLLALIPSFVLGSLTDLFIRCADNVRATIKRFLGWIYSKEDYKPKVKKWEKSVSDPFTNIHNFGIGGDMHSEDVVKPPIDMELPEEGDNGVPKYVVVIVLTVITIGFTYYMFPDLYHKGYHYIKGKLFPGKPDTPGAAGSATTHVGEVIVASEEIVTPSTPVEVLSKPVFGPELQPALPELNYTTLNHQMLGSEIDFRVTLDEILSSDADIPTKLSEANRFVTNLTNPNLMEKKVGDKFLRISDRMVRKFKLSENIPTYPSLSNFTGSSKDLLRSRLNSILSSDITDEAKNSRVSDLARILNIGADDISVSETNGVIAEVMGEYAKTQLTPKPRNVVLEELIKTPSFGNTSWTTPTTATPIIKTTNVPPFDPKTSGFK